MKVDWTLLKLAHFYFFKVYEISSDKGKSIHLAAVFANNFTTYLLLLVKFCADNGFTFSYSNPLNKETGTKLDIYLIRFAQTRPAKRNDSESIENI